MQTNYNTIILHLLMLLTICVLAQILSQNTPHFMQTAHNYTATIPGTPPPFQRNI